jgi:hypothetical protein
MTAWILQKSKKYRAESWREPEDKSISVDTTGWLQSISFKGVFAPWATNGRKKDAE